MTADTTSAARTTAEADEADATETTDLRASARAAAAAPDEAGQTDQTGQAPPAADEPTTELPHIFDTHTPPPVDSGSRPARHRSTSLVSDTERAMFLQQWEAVQTGFVTSPDGTAEAAERLVDDLARRIVRSVGTVRDHALRPIDEASLTRTAEEPAEVGTEKQRARLLQCREAFSLLIDC